MCKGNVFPLVYQQLSFLFLDYSVHPISEPQFNDTESSFLVASCLPNVCQATKNTPSRHLESVFLCPRREHFYMLIISVLQKFQAETQAVLECHNFWMVAPNKGSKINGKIGDEPVFFYDPFIGQDVSVVNVVVRIRQKSIECPMDCIVFP